MGNFTTKAKIVMNLRITNLTPLWVKINIASLKPVIKAICLQYRRTNNRGSEANKV